MKENKLYVVYTKRGYWVGTYIFSPQLRHAKIYTSLHYANKTAERLPEEYEPRVLEVFLGLASEGEWIKATPHSQEYCNKCGLTPKTIFGKLPPFCPNCGAKMKGGAE